MHFRRSRIVGDIILQTSLALDFEVERGLVFYDSLGPVAFVVWGGMGEGDGAIGGGGTRSVSRGEAQGEGAFTNHRAVGGVEFEVAFADSGSCDGGGWVAWAEDEEAVADRGAIDFDGAFDGGALCGGEKAAIAKPVAEVRWPRAEDGIAEGEADAVGAGLIDVKFGGNIVLAAGEVEGNGVFCGDGGVLIGLKKESGRRVGADAELSADVACLFVSMIRTEQVLARAFVGGGIDHGDDRVNGHGDIRTGAELVDFVVGHGGGFLVEEGSGHGGEVAAG